MPDATFLKISGVKLELQMLLNLNNARAFYCQNSLMMEFCKRGEAACQSRVELPFGKGSGRNVAFGMVRKGRLIEI